MAPTTLSRRESRLQPTVLDSDDIVAVPLRHPWRWVVAAILLAGGVSLGISLWSNDNVHHPTISEFIFNQRILRGVLLTLVLTVVAMLVSTLLGVLLAIMRLSSNPVMTVLAWVYVWVFRGTPLLIQIDIWEYSSPRYPHNTI